jgi:uncharacterized membrane protein YidH (DUF202 family)
VAEEVGGVRDHLANERTQLAWMRTGANVMVVGLAVARFADNGDLTVASLLAGGLLLLAGAVAVGYGTFRYRRVAAELRLGTAASATSSTGPTLAAAVMVTATLVAAVILLIAA